MITTQQKPLVSVCIPNYNYGQYLSHCLDSILNQTYTNYEVIFRDNNSTDDSYEIALSYIPKFKEKGIFYSVTRNKYNFGSDRNSDLCSRDSEGDFRLVLGSDDAIYPECIEKCVEIFTEYPTVSMVMVHRDEIDENGNVINTVPFYNQSCVIPREEQAAVFMMAGIAIPGQRVFRVASANSIKKWKAGFQVANDWYYNALLSCVGEIAYIKEPLMQYRVHTGNETNESEENLTAVMEHYSIIDKIAKVTTAYNMKKPAARLTEATKKLGSMCLRYAVKVLKVNKPAIARKYLNQALVFDGDLYKTDLYKSIEACLELDYASVQRKVEDMEKSEIVIRKVSYDPPEGSISLEL